MAPHPESPLHRGRVPRHLVRRSAALLVAAVVIGGTPLVARALDVEIAPSAVSGDLDTSASAQPEPRAAQPAESALPPTPAIPEPAADTGADAERAVVVDEDSAVDSAPATADATADAIVTPDVESDDPEPDPASGPDSNGTVEIVPVPADTQPPTTFPPGPAGSEWAALRQCESNGNYSITNPSGKYRGAYQFDRPTWNSVAERHAPRLVDVDPASASPADQDAMAYALYTERGAAPWPQCGRHLS